jgi:hypothetical protein
MAPGLRVDLLMISSRGVMVFDPTNRKELVPKDRLEDAVAHSRSRSARIGEVDARRGNILADGKWYP